MVVIETVFPIHKILDKWKETTLIYEQLFLLWTNLFPLKRNIC